MSEKGCIKCGCKYESTKEVAIQELACQYCSIFKITNLS
jgi:DNA-directed RNA polymerase subunit RPC12/RpoP